MGDLASTIADNLQRVYQRIAKAAEKAGRSASDVTLVGVTKYVGPREVAALVAAGCRDLGESRPQQLADRATDVSLLQTPVDVPVAGDIRWHLIGHLQRNKVARTLSVVRCIHSVDSRRLLDAIEVQATKQGVRPRLLLEVNCSGEAEKQGFTPEALLEIAPHLEGYEAVDVVGLMTMAARGGGEVTAARNFAALRELRDKHLPHLPELSMGMTGDFEVAIAEGATIVRVGSALWEGVPIGG